MEKKLFSQRMRYSTIDDSIIRERINVGLQNAICNCYDDFKEKINRIHYPLSRVYDDMECNIWRYFLNRRMSDFTRGYSVIFTKFILADNIPWYEKLDIIEFSLRYLYSIADQYDDYKGVVDYLVESLNSEFERLNYAYRIINKQIVEVTAEEEIVSIGKALEENIDTVREHLTNALKLCSKRPAGDYRNSIKESISAVEVICRKRTGERDLGKALSKLEKNGVIIPQMLKTAFNNLYAYTNDKVTGIRHALMDDEGTYTPGYDEAIFMIVSCSAFINYLNKK